MVKNNSVRLLPNIHAFLKKTLQANISLYFELISAFGSPLHFIFPSVINNNIAAFENVLNNQGISYRILYAHKTNKSSAIITTCAKNNIGVDVASIEELRHALGQGIIGHDIGVSGPSKSHRLLQLALRHNCLIQIDSLNELNILNSLAKHKKNPARILLRFRPKDQVNSRFGFLESEIMQILADVIPNYNYLKLEGFSFHLSGYDLLDRAYAIMHLIELIKVARNKGFPCRIINMGGGIPVSYVSKSSWEEFSMDCHPEIFHAQRAFDHFYPYHSELSGVNFLSALLEWKKSPQDSSLATLLKDEAIELLLEPGRSLVADGGVTIFKVRDIKEASNYKIITVDGTSFSLSEQWFNSEFLPEPLHLHNSDGANLPIQACVAGSSCLEVDVLSWRKITFNNQPKLGDLLMYVNTAGYQMDSNESMFHLMPLPKKIVLYPQGETIKWKTDEEFGELDL